MLPDDATFQTANNLEKQISQLHDAHGHILRIHKQATYTELPQTTVQQITNVLQVT